MYVESLAIPDIDGAEQIIAWLDEIGFYRVGDMGIRPIDWQELKAWADMTATELTPQQSISIIKASQSYVSAYQSGSNPNAPDPSTGADYDTSVASAMFSRQLMQQHAEDTKKKKPSK